MVFGLFGKSTRDTASQAESSEAEIANKSESPTLGEKVKQHTKRFWWLDGIIIAAVILIIVLPVVYLGFQGIAQSETNKSTLDITYQSLANCQPESFHMLIHTDVKTNSNFHARVAPFNASLVLENPNSENKPIVYFDIPELDGQSEMTLELSQNLRIADSEQFTDFIKLVIQSAEYTFGIKGRTTVKPTALPTYEVDFDKTITMRGMNGLSGFEIPSFSIIQPPASDGANMVGTISIPNTSLVSVEMGNVTMSLLSSNGTDLGYTLVPDLTLNPGTNSFAMRCWLNNDNVLTSMKDGMLDMQIIGRTVVNKDGKTLSYFEEALKENVIKYTLNVGAAFEPLKI